MITLQTFIFNPFQENTYLVYDETHQAIIIDAGCYSDAEIEKFIHAINGQMLIPVLLLSTHGHIDHLLGNEYLKNVYQIPYTAHKADLDLIEDAANHGTMFGLDVKKPPLPDRFLEDNEVVRFGNSKFMVIHLPGHSRGSIGFYSKEQKFIIVGDVLFKGSIGRTDLPGGDFDQLIHSIRSRLLIMEDETIVYAGHGPFTTIGAERRLNPFLR